MHNFIVLSNHKPLEDIFSKALFNLASPRLQRLRKKVTTYSFQVKWILGKTHFITDALCCAPLFAPAKMDGMNNDMDFTCMTSTRDAILVIIFDASTLNIDKLSLTSKTTHTILHTANYCMQIAILSMLKDNLYY